MHQTTPDAHTITDPDTMWVLASPARREVLKAACALGRFSVNDIADLTGRSRTSLYPHVEQLVEHGLLIEDGTRPSGKRQEQLYRAIARRIRTRHDHDNKGVVKYHIAYGKAVCRQLARLFEHAISRQDARTRGADRDTHCTSQTVWVDESSLEEINAIVDRLADICSANQPGEGKRLIQIGIVMAPEVRGMPNGDQESAGD
ncbi:MAG: helix-turn-helix domain-containing protein [Planctomycetota bacterium]